MNNIQKEGHNIELHKIEGRAFDDVIKLIKRCDFVVDQVYSDTPLAGFATEAAWFGKPALVCGYGLQSIKKHFPPKMFPPSYTCHPKFLEDGLRVLVSDRLIREKLGKDAQLL